MKTDKISKVLIALDYDPTAQKVAEEGYALAKAMGAQVILVHVISDPLYYSTGHITVMGFSGHAENPPLQIDSVVGLKKASHHFLDKAKQHLGDDNIQTIVKEGDVAESILNAATDHQVNIIVMGTHSRKWLENIIMGSVTEKVLQHTRIPMFIIPTKKLDY